MASAGGARDFGIQSDNWHFLHPNSFDPQDISFTYCAWIKPLTLTGAHVPHGISGSTYSFTFIDTNWKFNIGASKNTTIPYSLEWWFACLTYRESDGNVRWYGDTGTTQVTLRSTIAASNSASATGTYLIGRWGGGVINFAGDIGQTMYFDRELSLSEIQELQFNPASIADSNLQGNYPLWGVDDPEPDVSGNGRNTNSTVGSPGISDTSPPVFLLGGQ